MCLNTVQLASPVCFRVDNVFCSSVEMGSYALFVHQKVCMLAAWGLFVYLSCLMLFALRNTPLDRIGDE